MSAKAEYEICTEKEFPTGLRCGECDREIPPGTPYKTAVLEPGNPEAEEPPRAESAEQSIENFREAVANAGVALIVCVYCGTGEEIS